MKITVDRVDTGEPGLVFTITVTEPHFTCFSRHEKDAMMLLESTESQLSFICPLGNKVRDDAYSLIHAAKEKTFVHILDNLKFSIENEFRPMFKPICQEIYNWIYDHQQNYVKQWLTEFDPQRTKYYFHNDKTNNMCRDPAEISDDKIEDDDQDDDHDDDHDDYINL